MRCLLPVAFLLSFPLGLYARDTRNAGQQPKPLSFIENKGQVTDQYHDPRKDIDLKLEAPGLNIFIGDGAIHYQWEQVNEKTGKGGIGDMLHGGEDGVQSIETYRMDVVLVGANKNAAVIKEQHQQYFENYYLANAAGATVHTYNKVTYKDIYPGIDWVLYSANNELKYDFVVHAGGNVKDIKLRYDGAASLTVSNGALTAATPFGSTREDKPYSYDAETRLEVASAFVLEGNVLRFNTAKSSNVVIDPVLNWSTYYGGSLKEYYNCEVACDTSRNVYMAGGTQSANNIATTGAYQVTLSGTHDGMLVKFSPAGQRQWATYFGGSDIDYTIGLAYDPAGYIYLTGITYSTSGIATTGAHQTVKQGSAIVGDAMLVKFDLQGLRQWGTYYGNHTNEYGQSVYCDPSGNVYMAGTTYNASGMTTPGAHQLAVVGDAEGFLVKFNSAGVRQWGTLYGGFGNDYPWAVTGDAAGNVYLGGETNSASSQNEIATANGHQTSYGKGFFVKFNSGGVRQWGSYYGGTSDRIWDITCDQQGNIYVTGVAADATRIASPGAYQPVPSSSVDAYVAKFNTAGVRIWGTFMGGTADSDARSVHVDKFDNVYIGGVSYGGTGLATADGYQLANAGSSDAFVIKADSAGRKTWGTYYGGTGYDNVFDLATDKAGNLYMGCATNSTGGIATAGSHQPAIGGQDDFFLTKFAMLNINSPFAHITLCQGSSFMLDYTASEDFQAGNVFTVELSDATGSFASPVALGSALATTSGSIGCVVPASTPLGSGYRVRIAGTAPAETTVLAATLSVQAPVVPTVVINPSVPYASAGPFTPITFTAVATNAGSSPVYQWRKNGINIAGATGSTYTGVTQTDLQSGDEISVHLTSSEPCAVPKDTNMTIKVGVNLGIEDTRNMGVMQLYPNPNNGTFSILLQVPNMAGSGFVEVVNAIGQQVYAAQLPITQSQFRIVLPEALANGVYMLKLRAGEEVRVVRFTVNR